MPRRGVGSQAPSQWDDGADELRPLGLSQQVVPDGLTGATWAAWCIERIEEASDRILAFLAT